MTRNKDDFENEYDDYEDRFEESASENIEDSGVEDDHDDKEQSIDFLREKQLKLDEVMRDYLREKGKKNKAQASTKWKELETEILKYNKAVLISNIKPKNIKEDIRDVVSNTFEIAIEAYDPEKKLEFSRYYTRTLIKEIMTYYSINKDTKEKEGSCKQAIRIAAAFIATQKKYLINKYLLGQKFPYYKDYEDVFLDVIKRCLYPENVEERYNHKVNDNFYNYFCKTLDYYKKANVKEYKREIFGPSQNNNNPDQDPDPDPVRFNIEEHEITISEYCSINIEGTILAIDEIKQIPSIYKINEHKMSDTDGVWFRVLCANVFITMCKAHLNQKHYLDDIEMDAVNAMDFVLIDYVYVKENCRTFLEFEQTSLKTYEDIGLNDDKPKTVEIETPFLKELYLKYFQVKRENIEATTIQTYYNRRKWFNKIIKSDEILANFKH